LLEILLEGATTGLDIVVQCKASLSNHVAVLSQVLLANACCKAKISVLLTMPAARLKDLSKVDLGIVL